jgi:hypothetical protein
MPAFCRASTIVRARLWIPRRHRPPRLPPGPADPRAAHPPREGHLQHLHRPVEDLIGDQLDAGILQGIDDRAGTAVDATGDPAQPVRATCAAWTTTTWASPRMSAPPRRTSWTCSAPSAWRRRPRWTPPQPPCCPNRGHLDRGVELHGARAQRDHGAIQGQVAIREAAQSWTCSAPSAWRRRPRWTPPQPPCCPSSWRAPPSS